MKKLNSQLTKKERKILERKLSKKIKSYRRKYFLMAIPVAIQNLTATMKFPQSKLGKIERAAEIIDKCTNNIHVSIPDDLIKKSNKNLKLLRKATSKNRESIWRLVKNNIKFIMTYFQKAADDNPGKASIILKSGGFKVKKNAPRKKQIFKVENNAEEGVIDIFAPGSRKRSCYDWWFSSDGVSFVRMQPTVFGFTQKKQLVPGSTVYFRYELITAQGPQGLSRTLKLIVT